MLLFCGGGDGGGGVDMQERGVEDYLIPVKNSRARG
jgi:hypothetical protein